MCRFCLGAALSGFCAVCFQLLTVRRNCIEILVCVKFLLNIFVEVAG